jgi:hypothetical protein
LIEINAAGLQIAQSALVLAATQSPSGRCGERHIMIRRRSASILSGRNRSPALRQRSPCCVHLYLPGRGSGPITRSIGHGDIFYNGSSRRLLRPRRLRIRHSTTIELALRRSKVALDSADECLVGVLAWHLRYAPLRTVLTEDVWPRSPIAPHLRRCEDPLTVNVMLELIDNESLAADCAFHQVSD